MTNVYKIELLIVDHDRLGADGIQEVLQSTNYPNDCIAPQVASVEEREVAWSDEHPLNQRGTWRDEFARLFTAPARTAAPAPTLGVYRYSESFGRMGDLSGVFVAEAADVAAAMGKEAYLGEVLGKHSEVTATIDEDTVTLVTVDSLAVEVVRSLGLSTGTNPIQALADTE
jgi:hypothetical protein